MASILEWMSPEERDDVASGTPTLDVSASVQRAYDSPSVCLRWDGVVAARISAPIRSSVSGRITHGGGARLIATARMDALFDDSSSYPTYTGLVLDGAGLACKGIRCSGSFPNIRSNRIINIASHDDRTASAIFCDVAQGARITGNHIQGVFHAGNGVLSDNNGSARGIHVSGASAGAGAIIADNIIDGVHGEEGDGIHVVASGGSLPYLCGSVAITGNVITQASRRGIKVQAQDVAISGNVVTNTLDFAGQDRNSESGIDVLATRRVVVAGNIVDGQNYIAGVQALGTPATRIQSVSITGNGIRVGNHTAWSDAIGNAKPAQCGVRLQYADSAAVSANTVEGGQAAQIKIVDCTAVVCAGNPLLASAPNTYGVVVERSQYCAISDNIGSGVAHSAVVVLDDANNNTVRGNKTSVDASYAVQLLGGSSGNMLSDNQNNSTTRVPIGGMTLGNACANNRNLRGAPSGTPDIGCPFGVSSLGVANATPATSAGRLIRKMEVFDQFGGSIGYVPIYQAIT